jgi:hypothetical protein
MDDGDRDTTVIAVASEGLVNIIDRFQKRRAIKAYVKKLPGLLVKDYGRLSHYTPLQVRRTIERAGLDAAYACYAIAMFSAREDFAQFHSDGGESCDYDAMRGEVAQGHFAGDAGFTMADVGNVFGEQVSDATHGGSHDAGGGHGHGGH